MIRSLLLRRFVSSIAMFMLVWCQTSAAAHGYLPAMSPPTADVAAVAPCHQTSTDSRSDTSHQRDCQARCQSRDASFETAKIQLPAIDDLLLAVVSIPAPASVATCAAPNAQTVERAASPPLLLVYCRLLI